MDDTKRDALFKQIVDEHGVALRRLCGGYESDEALRHDLEQEVLLNLWRSLPRFRGDASLRTWMYRVAHNTASRHVRTALRRPMPTADEQAVERQTSAELNPEANVETSIARARLRTCIGQLRPLDRQLILLYLEDIPQADIAEITGLSRANVSTRVGRIKDELKTMVNP